MKITNVLSLFDGMSCGQIALERAGIKVENYFASELDKYAIKVACANYPSTIPIGDVRNVDGAYLPKIDLLIGGSPCQGFSFAGKQLNFDDPRSKLFFEYVRVLKECRPKYFLLENVVMKKEFQDIISRELGVEPIKINSALVSAQNRKRLYWTNIPGVTQPEDRGILLKDVVHEDALIYQRPHGFNDGGLKALDGKIPTMYSSSWEHNNFLVTGRWLKWWEKNKAFQIKKKYCALDPKKAITMTARQYVSWNGNFVNSDIGIRKLTPVECERLQTVPDGFTDHVSNTQRYKMLGNGWTVDVIAHIFGGIL